MIFPSPFRIYGRNSSRRLIEIEREYVSKFLETERPDRHRETLQETVRMRSSRPVDTLQHALVCFVERIGKFVKCLPQTWRETVS